MKLLFDIGGTHMRLAVSSGGNKLNKQVTADTPRNFNESLAKFKRLAKELANNQKISITVGGVPRFTKDKLTFWYTHPVIKELAKITESKIILENDSALAALGEAVFGAAQKEKIVGYLTFGTGFGGARIVNKQIDANYFGFEPKLQIANYDPKTDKAPSLSLFVSGRGISNRYHTQEQNITDKKTLNEIESWMKVAVNNAAVFWSPEIIVIGGGVGLDKDFSTQRIQQYINRRFKNLPHRPKIAKAKLKQESGLMGALALANK